MTKAGAQAEADIKFGYCTEFIIMTDKPLQKQMKWSLNPTWSPLEIPSYVWRMKTL